MADVKTEKQKNLEILEKLSKGKAVLDVTKAVNTVTSEAEKRYANVIMHYLSSAQDELIHEWWSNLAKNVAYY